MRDVEQQSVSFRAMEAATEQIFAEIRAGGPWSQRVVAAKTWRQSGMGSALFDGPARKPSALERWRGLEPLPPAVQVCWENENLLTVLALGPTDSGDSVYKEVVISGQNFDQSVTQLVALIQDGLESINPKNTEAIKIHKMPGSVKNNFPWLVASDEQRRRDPWDS